MSEENFAPAAVNAEPPASTEVVINPEVGSNPPVEPAPSPEPRVFSQEEVDKIVAKRLGKAERNWERRNREILETALSRVQQPPQPAPVQQDSSEPDPSKYESYTDYLRDLTRFEANQAVVKTKQESAEMQRQEQMRNRAASVRSSLQQKMEAASDKYEDFEEVVMASDLPISPGMAEIIAESEIGGELAYFLGKNRSEAARIAALSPLAAAKEIGRIEDKLLATSAIGLSKAPTPPTPLNTRSSSSKDPDKMSVEEWTKWRNEQLSKKRRI